MPNDIEENKMLLSEVLEKYEQNPNKLMHKFKSLQAHVNYLTRQQYIGLILLENQINADNAVTILAESISSRLNGLIGMLKNALAVAKMPEDIQKINNQMLDLTVLFQQAEEIYNNADQKAQLIREEVRQGGKHSNSYNKLASNFIDSLRQSEAFAQGCSKLENDILKTTDEMKQKALPSDNNSDQGVSSEPSSKRLKM